MGNSRDVNFFKSASQAREASLNARLHSRASRGDIAVGKFAQKANNLFKEESKLVSKAENSIAKSTGKDIPQRKLDALEKAKSNLEYSQAKFTTGVSGYVTSTTVGVIREMVNDTQISITKNYPDGSSKTFYNQKGDNGKIFRYIY